MSDPFEQSEEQRRAAREAANLAHALNALRDRVSNVERVNQISRGSIIERPLSVYDADENLVMEVGPQYDGSNVAQPLTGPIPPTPTVPRLRTGLRSVTVHWDGLWEAYVDDDGEVVDDQVVAPLDFARVEIHASTDPGFEADTIATLVGTFETPRGGDQIIPLSSVEDDFTIVLVARTLSGARGDASEGAVVRAEDVAVSDGFPPSESPTPVAIGQQGGVYLAWDPVENADPVEYVIYANTTSDVPIDDAHRIANVAANAFLANVVRFNPLTRVPYDVDSYFRIMATDADGPAEPGPVVAARAQRVQSNDLSDQVVTLTKLATDTSSAIQNAASSAATAVDVADDALSAAQAAQATADGSIRTYYQSEPPWAAGSAQPASVLGDMWFDQDDGQAYRWNGSSWQLIEDSSIAAALAAAQNAQTTADGKIDAYYSPTAPTTGGLGDLWYETDNSNKAYYCSNTAPLTWTAIPPGLSALGPDVTARALGAIFTYYQNDAPALGTTREGDLWIDTNDGNRLYRRTATAWVVSDDQRLQEALNAASNAQSTADGKIRLFAQNEAPTGLVAADAGDLWIDTNDGNRLWRWSGTAWTDARDTTIAAANAAAIAAKNDADAALVAAQDAAARADGKVAAYFQTAAPTGLTADDAGDLWYDTDDGNHLYRWSGSAWIDARDAAIQAAAAAAVAAQADADQALADAADAQATADGKVRTFFQIAEPTGLVAGDVGDLWFDTDDGYKMYRWSGTAWVLSADTRISTALTNAGNAQTTANSRITTFYQGTVPTSLAIGDLWVNTSDQNRLYRAAKVGANAISAGNWLDVRDAAIGAAASSASAAQTAANNALTAAQAAQATADGAVRTYYQATAPWTSNSDPAVLGDMWYDTDDGQAYRWNGSAWQIIEDGSIAAALAAAQNAQTTADGKITAYYQPAAPWANGAGGHANDTGDLWYDTDDKNRPYYWSGTAWVEIRDQTIIDAANAASAAQSAANAAAAAASAAQGDADQALADAGDAQATADGKVRTFFQTAEPTGLVAGDVGDLWFDTDDSNRMYRWSGTAWLRADDQRVAQALNDAATANGAAAEAQAAVDAAQAELDALVVGGANLLNNGDWERGGPAEALPGNQLQFTGSGADNEVRSFTALTASPIEGTRSARITYKIDYGATAPSGTVINNASHHGGIWWNVYFAPRPIRDAPMTLSVRVRGTAGRSVLIQLNGEQDGQAPWGNPPSQWGGSATVTIPASGIVTATCSAIPSAALTGNATGMNVRVSGGSDWKAGDTLDVDLVMLEFASVPSNYTKSEYDARVALDAAKDAAAAAQSTANSKITTYYQPGVPTSTAVGDLWVDTDDGNRLYRAAKIGATTVAAGNWVDVRDGTIATAAAAASAAQSAANTANTAAQTAQATADGAIRTYFQSAPPWADGSTQPAAALGDLWFDTDDKTTWRWSGTAWVKIEDPRISSALNAAQNAQTTADGKIDAYYQPGVPWPNGNTTHDLDVGDLWYDTDDGNKPYYWASNRTWTVVQDAAITTAQNTADSKVTTFYQTSPPTSLAVGDLWVDTDDGNRMYRSAVKGSSSVGAGGWVDVRDSGIAAASGAAAAAQNAASSALTAAQQAQAVADGAIRTYYQSAAPDYVAERDVNRIRDGVPIQFGVPNGVVGRWFGSVGDGTYTIVTGANPIGRATFGRKTWTTGNSADGQSGDTGYGIDTSADQIVVGAGDVVRVGAWLRSNRAIPQTYGSYYYGANRSAAVNGPALVANTWTWVVHEFAITAARSISLFGFDVTGLRWNAGDTLDISGVVVTVNDPATEWWDGDSAASASYTYAWLGAPRQTASARYPASLLGDMWYDTDDGQAYRWNGSTWQIIEDGSIAAALAAAQNAQTTADGKISTFFSTGMPWPNGNTTHDLDVGDLWYDTDDGNKPYYWASNRTWTALPVGLSGLGNDVTARNLGAITTYTGTTAPSPVIAGDMWLHGPQTINGVANKYVLKRWSGSAWVEVSDAKIEQAILNATNAANLADAKMRIFYEAKHASGLYPASNPTMNSTTDKGDLWFRTDEGNRPYQWTGTIWSAFVIGPNGVKTSDGNPPATSPTPTVIGGIGAVYLRWTPVVNADPVSYRIYGGKTSGFTPDVSNLLAEVVGTSLTVKRLMGVATDTYNPELSYDEDTYFKIISADADGPCTTIGAQAAGRPVRATGPDIAVESVQTEHMVAGSITGDLFSGELVLGSRMSTGAVDENEESPTYGQVIGQRVDLSPSGIELTNAAGDAVVTIPTDEQRSAYFRGRMETEELRVRGGTSIESVTNEIAKDAALSLSAGVTNPVSTPAVTFDYERIKLDTTSQVRPHSQSRPYGDFGPMSLNPAQIVAFGYQPYYNCWLVVQRRSAGGHRVWHFNMDGSIHTFGAGEYHVDDKEDWVDCRGIWGRPGYMGFGVFYKTSGNNWWVEDDYKINTSPTWQTSTTQRPLMFFDPLSGYMAMAENLRGSADNNVLRVRLFTMAPGYSDKPNQQLVHTSAAGLASRSEIGGMVRGNDLSGIPGNHYAWTYQNSDNDVGVSVINGGAAMNEGERWAPNGSPLGFASDGTSFYSIDAQGYVTKYSAYKWTDAADNIYAAISWYDSDTGGTPSPPTNNGRHETKLGAKAVVTARKRARIKVTLPIVPDKGGVDDPDKWRLYMCRASALPGDSAMIYQTEGGSPSFFTSVLLTSLAATSSITAPTINNFPGASPAKLFSGKVNALGREAFLVDGNGGGYWDALLPAGSITMFAAPNAPEGWLFCRGQLVSRSAYPALFNAIGTTFNLGGEAATDFRLPDLQSRMPVGVGTFAGLGAGDINAESARSLQHAHGVAEVGVSTYSHNRAANTSTGGTGVRIWDGNGNHSHSLSGSTGNSGRHGIPFLGLNFIIKT